MKRMLLVTAALMAIPAGAALAAPTLCAVTDPLAVADDPTNCFRGNMREEIDTIHRGAAGPVRSERPMETAWTEACAVSMVLATADDARSCLKNGGTLR